MGKAFRWALATAVVLATSGLADVAFAADRGAGKQKFVKRKLPKKAVHKAEPQDWPPAPIPARLPPSWSGFYAGVSIGGRMADADWTTLGTALPVPGAVPASAGIHDPTLRHAHLRLGIFGGYNWQMGPSWVVGVEGDFGWADQSRNVGGIPGTYLAGAPAVFTDSAGFDMRWDASARARLGVLIVPRWMFYGTGGLAWQSFNFAAACAPAGGYCAVAHNESASATRTGWTLGAGVEALLPGSWLMRAEYRYADFGHAANTFFAGSGDDVFADVNVRTHTLLFGLAYKFGGQYPAPISSRY